MALIIIIIIIIFTRGTIFGCSKTDGAFTIAYLAFKTKSKVS